MNVIEGMVIVIVLGLAYILGFDTYKKWVGIK